MHIMVSMVAAATLRFIFSPCCHLKYDLDGLRTIHHSCTSFDALIPARHLDFHTTSPYVTIYSTYHIGLLWHSVDCPPLISTLRKEREDLYFAGKRVPTRSRGFTPVPRWWISGLRHQTNPLSNKSSRKTVSNVALQDQVTNTTQPAETVINGPLWL